MGPAREKPWGLAAAGSSPGSPSSSGPFLPEQARRHRRRPRGSRDGCRGTCSIKRAEAVEEGAESSASREGRRTGTGRGAEEGPGRRQTRRPSTLQEHGGGREQRQLQGHVQHQRCRGSGGSGGEQCEQRRKENWHGQRGRGRARATAGAKAEHDTEARRRPRNEDRLRAHKRRPQSSSTNCRWNCFGVSKRGPLDGPQHGYGI